jgi:hypothetical protein
MRRRQGAGQRPVPPFLTHHATDFIKAWCRHVADGYRRGGGAWVLIFCSIRPPPPLFGTLNAETGFFLFKAGDEYSPFSVGEQSHNGSTDTTLEPPSFFALQYL